MHMDEISKNIERENLRIKISEDKKVGCLLWMDYVLIITEVGVEIQKILDITYNTIQSYYKECGQIMSQTPIICKNGRNPAGNLRHTTKRDRKIQISMTYTKHKNQPYQIT